jgi:SAM-dependent methyltransferase
MAKQGEIDYLRNLPEEGVRHAVRKPFSDADCARYLQEIGVVLALLPPPPARLLDVGCGTGWTTLFFARRGYHVVGLDISEDMIYQANLLAEQEKLDNVTFLVADFEVIDLFDAEFDAAVFYDALHHAVNEDGALRMVHQALKPGGVCIASEPGAGHAQSADAREAVRKYNVTEKDMPPGRIIAAGKRAGFRDFKVYPHAYHLAEVAYQAEGKWFRPLTARWEWARRLEKALRLAKLLLFDLRRAGLVVMVK